MKNKRPMLVRVEWLDALSRAGWLEKESVQDWIASDVLPVVSVGLLIREDDKAIVIAADENEDEWGALTKIPRGMVVAIEELRARKRRTKKVDVV